MIFAAKIAKQPFRMLAESSQAIAMLDRCPQILKQLVKIFIDYPFISSKQ